MKWYSVDTNIIIKFIFVVVVLTARHFLKTLWKIQQSKYIRERQSRLTKVKGRICCSYHTSAAEMSYIKILDCLSWMKKAILTLILQHEVVILLSCGRTVTAFQLLGACKHISWVSMNERRERNIHNNFRHLNLSGRFSKIRL